MPHVNSKENKVNAGIKCACVGGMCTFKSMGYKALPHFLAWRNIQHTRGSPVPVSSHPHHLCVPVHKEKLIKFLGCKQQKPAPVDYRIIWKDGVANRTEGKTEDSHLGKDQNHVSSGDL